MKEIVAKSEKIWDWVLSGNYKHKWFRGFREINKLEDSLRINGFYYDKIFRDGGFTIIFKDENGKHLGKAREDCFSEGCVMDLIEIFSLYESNEIIGFLDSNEAYAYFMNSFRRYSSSKKVKV